MKKNFTVEQVKSALLKVKPKMTENQRLMLEAHHLHGTLSMARLAENGGYTGGFRVANIQYGTLCGRIASELGFVPEEGADKTSTIATVKGHDASGHAQWQMDKIVSDAIKELNWFSDSSIAVEHNRSGMAKE
jgi:hypothetical protein